MTRLLLSSVGVELASPLDKLSPLAGAGTTSHGARIIVISLQATGIILQERWLRGAAKPSPCSSR